MPLNPHRYGANSLTSQNEITSIFFQNFNFYRLHDFQAIYNNNNNNILLRTHGPYHRHKSTKSG